MVSVQLGISVTEALLRLRAHAFSSGVPLDQIGQDVVKRRLRFDGPSTEGHLDPEPESS